MFYKGDSKIDYFEFVCRIQIVFNVQIKVEFCVYKMKKLNLII